MKPSLIVHRVAWDIPSHPDAAIPLGAPEDLPTPAARPAWAKVSRHQHAAASHRGLEHGTVGAVSFDRDAPLFAGTSTGGTCCKLPGRVGDSPLIGCGCYAD